MFSEDTEQENKIERKTQKQVFNKHILIRPMEDLKVFISPINKSPYKFRTFTITVYAAIVRSFNQHFNGCIRHLVGINHLRSRPRTAGYTSAILAKDRSTSGIAILCT